MPARKMDEMGKGTSAADGSGFVDRNCKRAGTKSAGTKESLPPPELGTNLGSIEEMRNNVQQVDCRHYQHTMAN